MKKALNVQVIASLDYLKENYTDYYLFKKIFNTDPNDWIKKHFKSPYRIDHYPTCSFRYKNDNLYFVDWKDGEYLSPINLIMKYRKLTFTESIAYLCNTIPAIDIDQLPIEKEKFIFKARKEQNKNSKIICTIQDFTKTDKDYLFQYGINRKICEKLEIFSISKLFINGDLKYVYSHNNPCLGFREDGCWQIYFYFNKHKQFNYPRFYNNTTLPLRNITRLDSNANHIIVTKSMKDVALLTRLGYNCVSVKSESHVDLLYLNNLNFKYKYILFDYDFTGCKLAHHITTFDPTWIIKYIKSDHLLYIPSYANEKEIKLLKTFYQITFEKQNFNFDKDVTDYFKNNGWKNTKMLCQRLFNIE